MNTYDSQHLLLCEKADLVEYIKELKKWSLSNTMIERTSAESIEEFEQDVIDNWTEIEELKEQVEELNEQVERCEEETIPKEFITEYLQEGGLVAIDDSLLEKFEGYKTELDKLKKQNKYLELNLKNQDNINAQHSSDISDEKKYSTEQRKRADKYMEENKKLKKELSEELLEGVKLHNANHLYKGFVCSHVIEKLKGDIDCVGDGQVDINFGNWLGLWYGEKFYEEIIPVIIKEITEHKEVGSSYEDGYWYYSWADKYELEHNKGGCISYTRIEDEEDNDE